MNRSNAIACMLLWVFAIVCVSCHFARNAPATQPIALSANEAITHSQAARTLIIDAQGDATRRSKPILIEAVDRTDKAIAAEKVVIDEAAAFQKFADESLKAVKSLEAKLADEQAKRRAAEEKYASAWFGGKFWFWVKTVSAILGLLIVGALILNYYTDAFVIAAKPVVWAVVGVIGGFLKFCWQALKAFFGGIVKLFKKPEAKP